MNLYRRLSYNVLSSMRTSFFIALACGALLAANAAWAAPGSADWVLSYEGKSTNAFIGDKRARGLIKNSVPSKLTDDVLSALGGPPDPVHVVDSRYFSASACVSHACVMKGFFWLDSQSGVGVGGYYLDGLLTLGSSRMLPGQLPSLARQAIIAWMNENDLQPTAVQFVSQGGKIASLAPTQFPPSQKYRPKPEGPSYDCDKASTDIETAICGNAVLAKLDLEVATLVRRIRLGHDTVSAQDELRSLQREWLKGRNAACKQSPAMTKCIEAQYRQQHDRLRHWVPTH